MIWSQSELKWNIYTRGVPRNSFNLINLLYLFYNEYIT